MRYWLKLDNSYFSIYSPTGQFCAQTSTPNSNHRSSGATHQKNIIFSNLYFSLVEVYVRGSKLHLIRLVIRNDRLLDLLTAPLVESLVHLVVSSFTLDRLDTDIVVIMSLMSAHNGLFTNIIKVQVLPFLWLNQVFRTKTPARIDLLLDSHGHDVGGSQVLDVHLTG